MTLSDSAFVCGLTVSRAQQILFGRAAADHAAREIVHQVCRKLPLDGVDGGLDERHSLVRGVFVFGNGFRYLKPPLRLSRQSEFSDYLAGLAHNSC